MKTLVDSSHLKSIDYSFISGTLTVGFKNGKQYEYEDVSAVTYAAFLAAPSKGLFFKSTILGNYTTKIVPGDE